MNDLKLFAKCYVEAHDLSNEDKKKLFEFIDNVTDAEVINLLETGRMEYLSETSKKQIMESLQLSEDSITDVPRSIKSLRRGPRSLSPRVNPKCEPT